MEQIELLEDLVSDWARTSNRPNELVERLVTREESIAARIISSMPADSWPEERTRAILWNCGLSVPLVAQKPSEAQQEALEALSKAKEANDAALAAILTAANRISDL